MTGGHWCTILFILAIRFLMNECSNNDDTNSHRERDRRAMYTVNERQEILDLLFKNLSYNSKISPDYELDQATTVYVQIYVNMIDKVSELNMDYSISIYLRQRWVDSRLSFKRYSTLALLELDSQVIAQVWVPDTFFRNEKTGRLHSLTLPNRLMHLYPNGTIFYSMKLSVTLACHMLLHKFPLDTQYCPIKLASYGYSTNNIIYEWLEPKPLDFAENLYLKEFTLISHRFSNCTKTYEDTGTFSCVQADFILKRNIGYYIYQVYLPCCLIVFLSWMSFFLAVEAVPARISLTILTMAKQSIVATSLPKDGYANALEVWLTFCVVFVILALLEYTCINMLLRRPAFKRTKPVSNEDLLGPYWKVSKNTESKEAKIYLICWTCKRAHKSAREDARYIDRCSLVKELAAASDS